jgi:hypothetical protein
MFKRVNITLIFDERYLSYNVFFLKQTYLTGQYHLCISLVFTCVGHLFVGEYYPSHLRLHVRELKISNGISQMIKDTHTHTHTHTIHMGQYGCPK